MKRLYLGNLPYSVTQAEDLREFFHPAKVTDFKIITDRETGRPRGFGFVELENDEQAQKAVDTLNGAGLGGRQITVSFAREKQSGGKREPRGGGGQGGRQERDDYNW